MQPALYVYIGEEITEERIARLRDSMSLVERSVMMARYEVSSISNLSQGTSISSVNAVQVHNVKIPGGHNLYTANSNHNNMCALLLMQGMAVKTN